MRPPIVFGLALPVISAIASAEDAVVPPRDVKPTLEVTSVTACKPLPESVAKAQQPMLWPGVSIGFMATGENLVGISGAHRFSGVQIRSILTPEGKELLTLPLHDLQQPWHASSGTPTPDHKHLCFEVHFDVERADVVGRADSYVVDGTVDVLMSPDTKMVTREHLKVGDKFESDGLTVSVTGADSVTVSGSYPHLDAIAGALTLTPAHGEAQTSSRYMGCYSGSGGGLIYMFGAKAQRQWLQPVSKDTKSTLAATEPPPVKPAPKPALVDPNAEFTVTIPLWQDLRRETLPVHFGKTK